MPPVTISTSVSANVTSNEPANSNSVFNAPITTVAPSSQSNLHGTSIASSTAANILSSASLTTTTVLNNTTNSDSLNRPYIPTSTIPSISNRRLSGFPALETDVRTDSLLIAMIKKLDTGFACLNETLRAMNNPPHIHNSFGQCINNNRNIPNSSQSPTQQNINNSNNIPTLNHPVEPRISTTQNPSNFVPTENDSIARLERMVSGLAIQVQNLSERMSSNSGYSQQSAPAQSPLHQNGNSNYSSYKTYPHKWKIKYDGDNDMLPIEFFFDQVNILK